jgi:hypothetical protein
MNGLEAALLLAVALAAVVGWHVNRANAIVRNCNLDREPVERDWQWPARPR